LGLPDREVGKSNQKRTQELASLNFHAQKNKKEITFGKKTCNYFPENWWIFNVSCIKLFFLFEGSE
jgi:hypothetical protein